MTERSEWNDTVCRFVRQRTMGVFVGNGLSRLCGAPSWGDLFRSPEAAAVLEREEVSQSTPNLELGYVLAKRAPTVWEGILRRLYDWAQTPEREESHAHRVLLQGLRPGQARPPNLAILTTNVDPLLESHGYRRANVGYIHGNPDDPEKWIFTVDNYWNAFNSDGVSRIFSRFQADGVLFLGYGHSHEDFDIAQTFVDLRKDYSGRMFTRLTRKEARRGDIRCRLDRQGVGVITYDLPEDATPLERDLFLTKALLELVEDSGLDRDPISQAAYQEQKEWCNSELTRRRDRRSNALIVLGLAGVNRHAALPAGIPTSERRVAEAAEIRVEASGPGYIVAALGRETGVDSFLVSKIASDMQGEIVREAIRGDSAQTDARIFADFVESAPPESHVRGFGTWESFILEPSEGLAHRVFIDRAVDPHKLDLSRSTKHKLATMLRDGSKRLFYFDRHYRESIVYVLRSPNYPPIASGVWTVYESDSDGSRYQFTSPDADFNKVLAYEFEKRLAADGPQRINVVAASFRFARDCLAVHYGDMPRKDYEALVSTHDTPEIVGSLAPTQTEDEIIAELVQSKDRLEAFANAVRAGANRFLRQHPLRLVVVTLHRHGALALTVPTSDARRSYLRYIPGVKPTASRLYTASAGDVFRGVLVSAPAHARNKGLEAEDVMEPDFLTSLVELCNRCASAKVAAPTLQDCVGSVKTAFDDWAAKLSNSRT